MAASFVVETGTGSATANSYVSLDDAADYFDSRGETTFAALPQTTRQAALVKATAYVDASYAFRGIAVSSTQALAWPRAYVVDENGYDVSSTVVPAAIKAATCELALYAATKPLTPIYTAADRKKRVKAGSVEVEYEDGATDRQIRFDLVDRLLSGLTRAGGMAGQAVRGW